MQFGDAVLRASKQIAQHGYFGQLAHLPPSTSPKQQRYDQNGYREPRKDDHDS